MGLFVAVTCREDVAFIGERDVANATRATYIGDFRVHEQMAACANWPKAPLPDGYRVPVRSTVPTMFVSGDSDTASPLWFTRFVAPGFENRVEIIARHQGHTEWSECIAKRYARFVRSGSTAGVSHSDCTDVAQPPFRLP